MRIISLLSALVALASIQTAQAAKRDASKVITIVALGDSLTAGYGLSRKEAYPALIAERMRSAGYEFEVTNAGWSGDTTAGGLRRLPEILRRKKIDVLIVELGINDAFRGVPIEQMRSNLQAIIDQTRARHPGVSIIVAGMRRLQRLLLRQAMKCAQTPDQLGAIDRHDVALRENFRER